MVGQGNGLLVCLRSAGSTEYHSMNPEGECRRWQPVVKPPRATESGAVFRHAALLLRRICPIFSLVAPSDPDPAPLSVARGGFTTGC